MPATGKVSLTRQTIFVLFPILDLIAFYKIKHLRKYLLIIYVGVAGIAGSAYSMVVTPQLWIFNDNYDQNYELNLEYYILQIPMIIIAYAISIFLVRKWSKLWNVEYDNAD